MKEAVFIYGSTDLGMPEFSADLLWRAGGYKVPDQVYFFEIEDKKILFLSSLEIERAAKEANADEVVHLDLYFERAKKENISPAVLFLKERGVAKVIVPEYLRFRLGVELSKHFEVAIRNSPFYERRALKNEWEISEIEKAQTAVELALGIGTDWLKKCRVREGFIFDCEGEGRKAYAGDLRKIIDMALFSDGFLGVDTIVSPGIEAADPHAVGLGPLKAGEPIVVDIFPRSIKTLYFSDQTRTIFKGEPEDDYKKMYNVVLFAQEEAILMLKDGVDGKLIHDFVADFLEKSGYSRNLKSRPVSGFIHGLGHGVGIDIHEPPRINSYSEILKKGNIVTIEPGLYYPVSKEGIPACGIRIEDILLIEESGAKNLTKFPKKLEDVIIS